MLHDISIKVARYFIYVLKADACVLITSSLLFAFCILSINTVPTLFPLLSTSFISLPLNKCALFLPPQCFLLLPFTSPLTSYLRKNPMIRWNAVKRWCRQILRGLEFLHTQHVIHRDIKCDNIFINGATGDLRIGDLGLSTKISEHGLTASLDRPITAVAMTCLGTPGAHLYSISPFL